jgi:hypothetical protein
MVLPGRIAGRHPSSFVALNATGSLRRQRDLKGHWQRLQQWPGLIQRYSRTISTLATPTDVVLPLTVDLQRTITSRQLAWLILHLLIRNDDMAPSERSWKISYYPYQLSSIRAFEIIGHAKPELPEFRRKWNESIALLKSKAFISLDPTQMDREEFMMPTSFAKESDLDSALAPLQSIFPDASLPSAKPFIYRTPVLGHGFR